MYISRENISSLDFILRSSELDKVEVVGDRVNKVVLSVLRPDWESAKQIRKAFFFSFLQVTGIKSKIVLTKILNYSKEFNEDLLLHESNEIISVTVIDQHIRVETYGVLHIFRLTDESTASIEDYSKSQTVLLNIKNGNNRPFEEWRKKNVEL